MLYYLRPRVHNSKRIVQLQEGYALSHDRCRLRTLSPTGKALRPPRAECCLAQAGPCGPRASPRGPFLSRKPQPAASKCPRCTGRLTSRINGCGPASSPLQASLHSCLVRIRRPRSRTVSVVGLLIAKRRRQPAYPSLLLPPKQAVAVKNVHPKVVQSATGLRQVISPVQSPLSSDSSPSPVTPFHSMLEERTRKLSPGELPEHRGTIDFELAFDPCVLSLQISVQGCTNLCELEQSRDGQCLLDPYVKIQLLPEKDHKVKTRIVRATTNPVYEEQFTMFGIGPDQIANTAIHFQVVAFDRYSRDTIIGEAVYRLDDADLLNKNNAKLSLDLTGDSAAEEGEVLVSLTYQPAFNNLTAVVLKARALPLGDNRAHLDPYIKLYLRKESGERLVKKKTHRNNQHPVYNESFVLELPEDKLNTALIDLQVIMNLFGIFCKVINHDRNNRNDVIGRALLNKDDPHVQEVLANPGRQVSKWHHLE